MKNKNTVLLYRMALFAVLTMIILSACPHPSGGGLTEPEETPVLEVDLMGAWKWNELSLEFTSPTKAALENRSYDYTYAKEERTGNISGIGDFALNEDGMTIIFSDYKGWGSPLAFKKFRENDMIGTYWRWGASLIQFPSGGTLMLRTKSYSYTYNTITKTGNAEELGSFAILEDEGGILVFTDYKGYGARYSASMNRSFKATFKKQEDDLVPDTLIGLEWVNPLNQWEILGDEGIAYNGSSGDIFPDPYTYDPVTKSGWIYFMNDFYIIDDGQTMFFPSYKEYGHTMTFALIE
jgi:hypothetical protein